jgi:hypothetical protein
VLQKSSTSKASNNLFGMFVCGCSWLAENSNRIRSMIRQNGDAIRERSTRRHKAEKCSWQLDAFKGISALSCWTQRNKNKHIVIQKWNHQRHERVFFRFSLLIYQCDFYSTINAHFDVRLIWHSFNWKPWYKNRSKFMWTFLSASCVSGSIFCLSFCELLKSFQISV